MSKVYYSHLENACGGDDESLSSSFWTDEGSEDRGESYVKDDNNETELGIPNQEINKEERYVKNDSVNEKTGEKLQESHDCKNEEDKLYYVKEQNKDEDSGKRRGVQVSQRDDSSVKTPGEENDKDEERKKGCRAGSEDEESGDYRDNKGCAGEEMSDLVIENLCARNEKAQSKEQIDDKEVEENSEEEQSMCFFFLMRRT